MRKQEYSEAEVLQVFDFGYEKEAMLDPAKVDVTAPMSVRLCGPCLEGLGRYRVASYGDAMLGEESVCKVHHQRRLNKVSEAAYNAPIKAQGRPRRNAGACTKEGCDKPQKTKNLCGAHYMEIQRKGLAWFVD